MDVLDHLTEEHRQAERLLAKLKESQPGDDRKQLLAQLSDKLTVHMELEEDLLYPLVDEHLGAEHAEEGETEHDLARDGLEKLAELVDRPGFGAAVTMLIAGLGHHVREEENEIFPKLRQKAGDDIEALGDAEVLERGRDGEEDDEDDDLLDDTELDDGGER